MFAGMERLDDPVRGQKAISPSHLKFMFHTALAAGAIELLILADLAIGAFFFAMRSCEYLTTDKPGRTKKLELRDLVFRTASGTPIPITSPEIHDAASVSITFRDQKNGKKMAVRTQNRTSCEILCPVRRWASIVHRLVARFGDKPNTPINRVATSRRLLRSKQMLDFIRLTAKKMGPMAGYAPEEVGCHSIRSGAAMCLILGGAATHKVMLVGRWSSDAFIAYIRPQIDAFTSGLSEIMIRIQQFRDLGSVIESERLDPNDPLLPNDPNASRNQHSDPLRPVTMSQFHIY